MNKILIDSSLSENISITPEGFLLCKAVKLARTGEYTYYASDNLSDYQGTPLSVNEYGYITVNKPKEVLFNPKTLASFEGKPVTIEHTFITSENYKADAVGHALNVRASKDEVFLIADLLITDKDAIELIKQGNKREISLGYQAVYKDLSNGYAEQMEIIGNHIAIVDNGRAGVRCMIADSYKTLEELQTNFKEVKKVKEDNKKIGLAKLRELLNKTFDNFEEEKTGDELSKEEEKAKDAEVMEEPNNNQDLAEVNIKLDKILQLLNSLFTTDEDKTEDTEEKTEDAEEDPTIDLDPDNPLIADADVKEEKEENAK